MAINQSTQKNKKQSGSSWLKAAWKDFKPLLLLALGLITLVLGTIGFHNHNLSTGGDQRWIDSFYRALNLFGFGAGDVTLPIPWELELARWSGPLATIFAAFWGLISLFRQQIELILIRLGRKHVIICGLGRKGLILAKRLRSAGWKVAVIEKDGLNPNIAACKESGAVVIQGDAREAYTLQKAGISRARHLLAFCGDDSANIELIIQAQNLAARRKDELNLLAHLDNFQFCAVARMLEFKPDVKGVRLEFFNTADAWAKKALNTYPLDFNGSGVFPHILLIGLNDVAERLLLEAARQWVLSLESPNQKLPVLILEKNAEEKLFGLTSKSTLIQKTCEFEPYSINLESLEFENGEFLADQSGVKRITHVFVCLSDSSQSLNISMTMANILKNKEIPIIVQLSGEPGLSKLFDYIKSGQWAALHGLDLLDSVFNPELVEYGSHEILARVIHNEYLQEQKRIGVTPEEHPSVVPWEQLPEELKMSNRRQADGIGDKLAAAGCTIIPWIHYGAERFNFTPQEVEKLARMEHDRWRQERIAMGWRYGPQINRKKKIHPSIISWEDPNLSEYEKQKDRDVVNRIPLYLALSGFEILRIKEMTSMPEYEKKPT